MRNRILLSVTGGLLSALALAAPVQAQEGNDPIPARVRYFEGTVTVQRAHAAETSAALVNLPLDAGDRLWTDGEGRAEVTLGDGTTLWLDHLTTVDVVALPAAGGGDAIVRLWGGALIAERPAAYERAEQVLRIDTAEATIVLRLQGSYRIDLDDEHRVWLSVYDGNATMTAAGLTEIVAAGETTYVEPGTAPAEVTDFNTAEHDGFSSWQIERWVAMAETQNHVRNRDYVPEEARPYAADLEGNGDWVYYDDFSSYAWRPSVAVGWAPYRHGRWVYSYAGWTWVPYASWGWATSHYGRWHHTPSYGWMWFPGSVYSPGWVSWYAGSGYLGWSPLGYYNRPFLSVNLFFGGHYGYGHGYHGNYNYSGGRGGKAVAGRGYARNLNADYGWTFVNADHFGSGKGELRSTGRTAVPRQGTGNALSFDGNLRPRKPSLLANVATSRTAVPTRTGVPTRGGVSTRGAVPTRPTRGTLGSGTSGRSAIGRGDIRSTRPPRGTAGSGTSGRSATDRGDIRSTRPSRGTLDDARSAVPRGSTVRPRSPLGSSSSDGRGSRATTPTRPRSGVSSRGPARPRSGSSVRPRSGSGAQGSSDRSGARGRISVTMPSTSRYQPQISRYQPDTSRYQPGSSYRSSGSTARTPWRSYQPPTSRYVPGRSGSSTPRYAPSSPPRTAVGSRSGGSMPRSYSVPRSYTPRSFSSPGRSSIRSSGSRSSGRSFSAPSRGSSRGSSSRSSGRSASRRSGRR